MISRAMRANLATYWDAADQQRPIHQAAIMEGAKIIIKWTMLLMTVVRREQQCARSAATVENQ